MNQEILRWLYVKLCSQDFLLMLIVGLFILVFITFVLYKNLEANNEKYQLVLNKINITATLIGLFLVMTFNVAVISIYGDLLEMQEFQMLVVSMFLVHFATSLFFLLRSIRGYWSYAIQKKTDLILVGLYVLITIIPSYLDWANLSSYLCGLIGFLVFHLLVRFCLYMVSLYLFLNDHNLEGAR